MAEAKVSLRVEMRALRRRIDPDERRRRAAPIAEGVLSLEEVERAAVVAAFHSFGAEVSTEPLISGLETGGRSVLLPYLEDGELRFAAYSRGDELVETSYGPAEPADRRPVDPSTIDAVIVPGLAFDRSGHRLGYGGGYYDRFLGRLRRLRPGAPAIAPVFSEQLVERVPAGDDDAGVDVIVTDAEVIRISPGSSPG